MDMSVAINVIRESIVLILVISGIIVIPSFIVGLMVSIFQATTQIQEQTLTFIPKLLITLLMLMLFGPYIATKLSEHFITILNIIANT